MKIDLSFFANSVVLFAIIIALTGFKIFNCKPFNENGEDFSWQKLIFGLLSNLGILSLLSFVYFVGEKFGHDLAVIQIGDAVYTIQAMLNALIILAIGVYGVKLYQNAVEYFGIKKETREASAARNIESSIDKNVAIVDYNVEMNDVETTEVLEKG